MVLVSHRYKFIYLKNYKVAGSSVESFFGQFCINPLDIPRYTFEDKIEESVSEYGIIGSRMTEHKKWFNHKTASDIRRDIGTTIFNEYFKFCVVRNPYDLMVSSYFWEQQNKKNKQDFKTYCKHYSKTINYFTDNVQRIFLDNKPVCQYYIRYEHLVDDILVVLDKLGITDFDITKLPNHKSGIRPSESTYKEYYDEETKQIVYNLFKREIILFGYTF
jgi:hypothetical protein